jgi:PAS domain S-box-containing protein
MSKSEPSRPSTSPSTGSGHHILCMEDDVAAARLLQKRLERAGYVVDVAHDGEGGLAKYDAGSYDVVIVDQNMPVRDGLEVIRLLASRGSLPPTIMVTGAGDEKTAVEAMKLGASDYIVKDVDGGYLELLSSVVERALYQHRLLEEKRRAEEALRESEDRYRDLVEHSHDLICTHDLEGQILSVNQGAAKLLGYDRSVLLKKNIRDILVPEVRDEFDTYLATIRRRGVASGLMLVQTNAGERRLWEYNNTLRTEGVAAPVVRGMAHDITEHKEAEEERERRSRELAMLNEIGRAVTSSLDLNEVLVLLLDRARQGLDAEACSVALLDEDGDLVFHHAEGNAAKAVIGLRLEPGQGIAGQVAQSGQSTLVPDAHADPHFYGEVAPGFTTRDMVCVPLVVRDKIIGVIEVINKCRGTFAEGDVRLLESVATQAATAIENARLFSDVGQAKAEWEATFDAIGDGIFIHDRGFRLVRVNRALTERLGIAPEVVMGRTCYELFHHTTNPPPWCPHLKAMKTGQPHAVEVEEPVLCGTFLISAYPLFDEQGQVSASVHVLKDITKQRQLEAQLRQAQKMKAIGQLAGGIAHDFNNLLTPIGGFAELLLWKAPEGSQQEKYLRQIKVAAERAAALTHQLRLFTRQGEGEHHPIRLNSIVEETCDLLEHSISREIAIELRLEAELWAVEADPSQISQVLVNLCVNACDAMPDGGTLTLETSNVTLDEEYARTIPEAGPGRYVRLSVSDTGCGMSPEVQARLFEPFFTTKEVGKGTGLGLSVAYGIVKGHSGFINVYSQEGQGSTFRIYLPAVDSAVEERGVEGSEWPTGTETILLVDDEEAVRGLGQSVLELCGYTVLIVEDGVQALEVYQAHQGEIPLVVLDVIMPQMGGRECLRRLREMDPDVKVLISTGYTADDSVQELLAEGALGVVEKPFRIQDFAVAVRAALDKP